MKATVFTNGHLCDGDGIYSGCDSIASFGGRIVCIGEYRECLDSFPRGVKPEIIDLGGNTVIPGFVDSHIHLLGFGLNLQVLSLVGVTSIEELKEKVRERALETEEGGWVIGRGWDQGLFLEKDYPTRYHLDEVAQGHPVFLVRSCGHIAVASSKALEIAGINRDIEDPTGGVVDRDSYGEPTGILRESALGLVQSCIPKIETEAMEDALTKATQYVLSKGITSVHTNDGQAGFWGTMDLYRRVREKDVPLRVYWDVPGEFLEELSNSPLRTGDGDDYFRIGAVKLFADGSLGGRTAALEFDYSDDPGNNGILVVSEEDLKDTVHRAHSIGMQVAIHAIGDRAVKVSLEAIDYAQSRLFEYELRHRIVHAQILTPALISEMKRVGVVADIQPKFLSTDMLWALDRVGPERMQSSYSWRSMLKAGIPLAGGSDCPVEPPDPLFGIYCAMTRKDMHGNPPSGFFPNERLTVDEALDLFTLGGAFGAHEEKKKGRLSRGNLCDFVVLSDDIYSIAPDLIKDLSVLFTVVGGDVAYEKT